MPQSSDELIQLSYKIIFVSTSDLCSDPRLLNILDLLYGSLSFRDSYVYSHMCLDIPGQLTAVPCRLWHHNAENKSYAYRAPPTLCLPRGKNKQNAKLQLFFCFWPFVTFDFRLATF